MAVSYQLFFCKKVLSENASTLINLQALLDLISTLPIEKQEEIKAILARSANHIGKITRTLNAYFSQTQIRDAFEAVSKKTFEEYIKAINHTLSTSQRQELTKIFQDNLI